jgi:hypothetical protein
MKIRQNLVKITTLNCILIMEINRIFTRKKLSVISQYFSGTPAARILPFFYVVFFYSVAQARRIFPIFILTQPSGKPSLVTVLMQAL